MRKVLKNFKIFSQAAGPVGKPNHRVHWVLFAGIAGWVLCFVCAESWSFRVEIVLLLFFWIPRSMRKVLTSFEIFSQPVGKPNSRFIGLCLPKQQFGYFALFVSVLGHSESELHSICFFGFLTL